MKIWIPIFVVVMAGLTVTKIFIWQQQKSLTIETQLSVQLSTAQNDLTNLQNSDQINLNKKLMGEIEAIKKNYLATMGVYESLVELKGDKKQFGKIDADFATVLAQLSGGNYASASATLAVLTGEIKILRQAQDLQAAAVAGTKPQSGQAIHTDNGDFVVNMISADLTTTKVVVETASESDCANNCPVMTLATFVQRSGAYAAINGPYFCPASYPSCAGKTNSFDTLMMNKNKHYFNSDNNVYSNVPAAIFSTTSRFVTQSSQWGRDTGVDSVIAGQPMLVFNGQTQFSGDGDPKKSGKGSRTFIGGTDNTVYIGIVYNATVAEAAGVVAKLGIRNAINLDSGGSVAMWNGGKYVAGPGRDLPFGIMLVKR